ncbi:unnamed protein product [Aureobasidium pullulans]|nr:unnamed protein product [Aureobasidium pullulans]
MNSLSFSLGGSSSKPSQRRSPPPTERPNGTKRDHAALLDDASDDEDASTAKRQTITHFDTAAGGATDAVKYGLNVFAPNAAVVEEDTPMDQEADQQEERAVKKTADQLAIDALTGAAPTSTLTIPAAAAAAEEDAFADSFHSAPPAPSLSDYAAVPVEEYGAAMLRGMGWKGPPPPPPYPPKSAKITSTPKTPGIARNRRRPKRSSPSGRTRRLGQNFLLPRQRQKRTYHVHPYLHEE